MSLRNPFLAVVLVATGCATRIQHGLDERQANEIQTVLLERGFDANKVIEPGKKPTWSIEVDENQAMDAVRVLSELGLPRPKAEGFGDVFGKGSLVPSPTEERAMFLQALTGEIARTLETVEGVTSARVHLVIPPPARPGLPAGEAKASAFLRVRPGAADPVKAMRLELRSLIAGSVEGLRPDDVTLVVSEVATTVPAPTKQPSMTKRLKILVIGLGFSVIVLLTVMVLLTLRMRALRAEAEKPRTASPAPIPRPAQTAKRAA